LVGSHGLVRLRFRLDHAARVTFVLYGPAPRCAVAGRFSVVGHRGANVVRFGGRVRHELLPPGVYAIAPRLPGSSARVPGRTAVVVLVDALGARPTARRPHLDCGAAAATTGKPELVLPTPLLGGVAGLLPTRLLGDVRGARFFLQPSTQPASAADTGRPTSHVRKALSEVGAAGSHWPLVGVFGVFGALMAGLFLRILAGAEFGYAGHRFSVVRILEAHRAEVGVAGMAFLGLAGILLVLMHFS
jgi:hypothetical protein